MGLRVCIKFVNVSHEHSPKVLLGMAMLMVGLGGKKGWPGSSVVRALLVKWRKGAKELPPKPEASRWNNQEDFPDTSTG